MTQIQLQPIDYAILAIYFVRPRDEGEPWYRRPGPLAGAVLAMTLVLNLIFF